MPTQRLTVPKARDAYNRVPVPLRIDPGDQGMLIRHAGGSGTIYYKSTDTVSDTSSDGTLTAGQALAPLVTEYLVASERTDVLVQTPETDLEQQESRGVLNLRAYGCRGDGVTVDRQAFQSALTAGAGKTVAGVAGDNYLIDAPLVISAGTQLDLTGCTVTLKASTGGNMLVNTALSAARSVIDGAITASAATLTSATAVFTSADVGKAVTVADAGSSGQRLVTTISAFTNATTVTLAANASVTVTNAWVTIGSRDRGITLTGGLWDRAANGSDATGKGYSNNTIRLRRCDAVLIEGVEVASTAGKYGVNLGDIWDFETRNIHGRSHNSDILHINGPARHGHMIDTSADYAGDDIVSITGSDFNTVATMADVAGDVAELTVDGVTAGDGARRGALLIAGTAPAALGNRAVTATNVTLRNVHGMYPAGASVTVGGDSQDAATLGGTYAGLLVDDVKVDPRSVATASVLISEGTFEEITLRKITSGILHDRPVAVGAAQPATVKRLVVDDVSWTGGTSPNGFVTVIRGTVTSLIGTKFRLTSAGSGICAVAVINVSSTPTLSRIILSDCDLEQAVAGNSSYLVSAQSTTTVSYVSLANIHTKNMTYPLGRYFVSPVRVIATACAFENASAILRSESGANITLDTSDIDSNTYATSSGGGAIVWRSHRPGQLVAKSAAYTVDGCDETVTANATGAAFQVTLPTAVNIGGRRITVKKTDVSANAVTVGTTSAQTIDGAASFALAAQFKYITVQSDGANWINVGSN
jgi:hypothetical protein